MSDEDIGAVSPEPDRTLPRYTKEDLTCVVDEFGREHLWTPEGRAVCGRLRKKKNRVIEDEACLAPPMPNGACRVHGGKAGRPITTGRYSRVLKSWKTAFERAFKDQDLVDPRRDLALLDVTIEQLLQRAEDLDSPSWREELRETFARLRKAMRSQRQAEIPGLLRQVEELIERGATVDQVTEDLVAHVDRRANRACKVVELQWRHEQKVSLNELTNVFEKWLLAMKRELPTDTYFRLVPILSRLTGAPKRLVSDEDGESGQPSEDE